MKELTKKEIYEFISEELTYYPELPQFTAEELIARKDDNDSWEELEEQLARIKDLNKINVMKAAHHGASANNDILAELVEKLVPVASCRMINEWSLGFRSRR